MFIYRNGYCIIIVFILYYMHPGLYISCVHLGLVNGRCFYPLLVSTAVYFGMMMLYCVYVPNIVWFMHLYNLLMFM